MLDARQPSTATALLAALIDAMPEPVLAVTGEGRVLAANGPAKAVLPALRIGGDLTLALRDPDILDAVDRVRASGQMEQVSWRDRVPVERVFDVTVAPLDRPDEDRALVLTLRDVTESLRIERMRADFVANASHELRTPLASLLGFVETLQGPARDDARARARFLAIMADQARRMARLIDDLLSLSRIEGNLHIRPKSPSIWRSRRATSRKRSGRWPPRAALRSWSRPTSPWWCRATTTRSCGSPRTSSRTPSNMPTAAAGWRCGSRRSAAPGS